MVERGNIEEKVFRISRDFSDAVRELSRQGLTHFKLEEGFCLLKPMKGPVTDCKLLVTCYTTSGVVIRHRLVYKGGSYDEIFAN